MDERGGVTVGDVCVHISREYGTNRCVARWLGRRPDKTKDTYLWVGVDFEDAIGADGRMDGELLFVCKPGHGAFVLADELKQASTFYGSDQEIVHEDYTPVNDMDAYLMFGDYKGIQGHLNSCYLDATLFAMYSFSYVFDSLLFRPKTSRDVDGYSRLQELLRYEIVNPLRKRFFVKSEHVMKLRRRIGRMTNNMTALTTQEQDPAEFLEVLFGEKGMRTEPFIRLTTGETSYFYQLLADKSAFGEKIPTVQQLFDQSILDSKVQFELIPPVLILQMPRESRNKVFQKIQSLQVLDITDAVVPVFNRCGHCSVRAEKQCRACFTSRGHVSTTYFCLRCYYLSHSKLSRADYRQHTNLTVPCTEIGGGSSRIFLELFAIVCIETSHYVSFVRAGESPDAPWCFFDSMADRVGEEDGFNVPRVTAIPDMVHWLAEESLDEIQKGQNLPKHTQRLLSDVSLCFYQNREVSML